MGTVVVIGIALAAVLSLATHEQRILARTTSWNIALPAAEAGIEEAMSHLRKVNGGPRAVNGWVASGSSFVLSRTNATDSRFTVAISSTTPPVIQSFGEVSCPSAGRYIGRSVQVTTMGNGKYHKGLMAKGKITMSGQFSADSFDSLKPGLNINGQYDPSIRSDNGDVGTLSSEPGAISMGGQVKIYGHVATGPTGTVNVDSQASVGTETWVDGGNTGVQTGYHTKDMNVSFPNATLPYTNSGATPLPGTVATVDILGVVIGNTSYKYILEDGVDYRLSTLVMSSSDKMLVRGKARLVVDQDVSLSGQSYIQIDPKASLELYVKQSAVSISGSSIINKAGNAANFSLYGLPGLKDINMSGGGSFIGTIYAPQTSLKMSGGGSDVLDFIGAGIFNEVTGSGNFRFHYDESLAYNNAENLVVTSWKEL
jgi:Tfp pilus assembly protein PilX